MGVTHARGKENSSGQTAFLGEFAHRLSTLAGNAEEIPDDLPCFSRVAQSHDPFEPRLRLAPEFVVERLVVCHALFYTIQNIFTIGG